jgi:hypothetical protein
MNIYCTKCRKNEKVKGHKFCKPCRNEYERNKRLEKRIKLGLPVRLKYNDLSKCIIESCNRSPRSNGMCNMHYERKRSYGKTSFSEREMNNFLDKETFHMNYSVDPQTGCWNWIRFKYKGYGEFNHKRKKYRAHRFSYELFKEKIPDGMIACHSCDNPACVNPDHIFLGTHSDNNRDMVNKNRNAKGSQNGNSKLAEDKVIEIKRRLNKGDTIKNISADFGVKPTAICNINSNKTWKHVKVGT